MPQPGVHAVLALATRKTFSNRRWFALGLAFGSLLPDTDGYAQAYATIVQGVDPHLAGVHYHRTLTHSLYFALGIALILYFISLFRGGESLRNFGVGLGVGMAVLHTLPDIFLWFNGVWVLWPWWSINLWDWVTLPELAKTLLRAANFWAFVWYFAYLARLAHKAGTNTAYLPRLRLYTNLQIGLGIIFTILAFVVPASSYNIPDGAAFLVWAYPNILWVTWQMKQTIETA